MFVCCSSLALFATACGGPSQSDECKTYIACAEAVAPGTSATIASTYGEDGACWENDDTASACTNACKGALAGLATSYPDEAACK
ncbi:MAG: hypothetical protein H6729_02630 [Deltaproteobacteria bacterium]|nr:hypothetical protein [Deltaproteobacteria bacterium]